MGRESSGFWIDVLIKLAIPRDPGLQCVGPYLTQPGVSRHASALILCRIKTPKHTGSGLQQDKEGDRHSGDPWLFSSKDEALIMCWFDAGPASKTADHHQTNT